MQGAAHSLSLPLGLDQEMPASAFFNASALASLPLPLLDRAALRVLRSMQAAGLLAGAERQLRAKGLLRAAAPAATEGAAPHPPSAAPAVLPAVGANVTSEANRQLARRLAAASAVLLKNNGGLLPLSPPRTARADAGAQGGPRALPTLLLVGRQAVQPITGGGGSGAVVPAHAKAPLTAVRERLGGAAAGGGGGFFVEYDDGADAAALADAAGRADIVLALVGCSASEGADRADLRLGGGQDELLSLLAHTAGSRMVAAVVSPGPVVTAPWAAKTAAVLALSLPGEQHADALVDLLLGLAEPRGRLPLTWPNTLNEQGWPAAQFPGTGPYGRVEYREGMQLGYRWYDAHGVQPAFAFGHGLSYGGPFRYSQLLLPDAADGCRAAEEGAAGGGAGCRREVRLRLANEGEMAGTEVAQLYVRLPASEGEPFLQLKGFSARHLMPGASETVSFSLTARDLSVWDERSASWRPVCGQVGLFVGASVADIRLRGELHLPCPAARGSAALPRRG